LQNKQHNDDEETELEKRMKLPPNKVAK